MRHRLDGHGEQHRQACIRNCLVTLALTYLFLLLSSFLLYVPLMGHKVAEFGRDVLVSAFAISAHMLAERFSRRLRVLTRNHPPAEGGQAHPRPRGSQPAAPPATADRKADVPNGKV